MECETRRDCLQIVLLLLGFSVTVLCQQTITGIEGQSITLPCSYKVKRTSDLTTMCWGRGSCPNSKCSQELIWTDGNKVTFRASSRYQLNDRITQGRVSLTISQASLQDAGTYCCRIEHQGWFNDEKINVRLTVEKAPPTTTVRTTTPATTTTTTTTTTPRPTTVKTTTTPPPMLTTPEPFIPLNTSVEVTTYPPPAITINTSPPPLIRTESPPSLSPRTITRSTNVFPIGTTESKDLIPRSSGFPVVTTESEPQKIEPTRDRISDFPGFTPDHEDLEQDHTTSAWPKSLSPDNDGISDLFQGNVTALQRKDTSTIVIVAISVSVVAVIVICVILLQLKVRKQGHYPLGLDPHLELVTHAEEAPADTKDHNTAGDEDKAKTNHIGNISED